MSPSEDYEQQALWPDLMTDLVKRTPTVQASGVISQRTEKARRSTSARRLQMSSVNGLGSMSIRRCTRYVVVDLFRNTQTDQLNLHALEQVESTHLLSLKPHVTKCPADLSQACPCIHVQHVIVINMHHLYRLVITDQRAAVHFGVLNLQNR